MAMSIKASIEPALLVWARKSLGLPASEVAKKLELTEERLLALERGQQAPTMALLKRAARLYHRPLEAFFLPAPPDEGPPLEDYRRLDLGGPGDSTALRLAIREARFRQEIAPELADATGSQPITAPWARGVLDDPARAAVEARGWLAVTWQAQRSWRAPRVGLSGWRRAVEGLDVLVVQFPGVEVSEARGFSVGADRFPVIALNAADAEAGRTFTLLHELGHFVRRGGGVCGDDEGGVEAWCNAFAGEVLVPSDLLASHAQTPSASGRDPSDEALDQLARDFAVSREVVARRLLALGRVSGDFYERKRAEYLVQRQLCRRAIGSGGPSFARVRVSQMGRPFVHLVLDALARGRITASDAAAFLDVRVKHFPALEAEARW